MHAAVCKLEVLDFGEKQMTPLYNFDAFEYCSFFPLGQVRTKIIYQIIENFNRDDIAIRYNDESN